MMRIAGAANSIEASDTTSLCLHLFYFARAFLLSGHTGRDGIIS